jgi:hypothetical protein
MRRTELPVSRSCPTSAPGRVGRPIRWRSCWSFDDPLNSRRTEPPEARAPLRRCLVQPSPSGSVVSNRKLSQFNTWAVPNSYPELLRLPAT